MRIESIVAFRPRRRSLLSRVAPVVIGLFLLPMATVPSLGARDGSPEKGSVVMTNPMPGSRVTSSFGERIDPFDHVRSHHDGIDLAATREAPVRAAADGVVVMATTHDPEREHDGTLVLIDHGHGLQTFYSHLESLRVEEGARVKRGDILGAMGTSGRVTGPHLHFEVREDGKPVDPAGFVSDWR